ncbi:excinuclease ABC subunit A, partial [Enterococcus faecalis]
MYFDYNFEPRGDYLCIDCKSFYASVECVARGLNPLTAMLVVLSGADRPGGLVLASSPTAKRVLGISNVTRKFELPNHPDLLQVPPRMGLYIETNMKIVNIIRRYVSDDDIHVYSIDELFIRYDKVKNLYGNIDVKLFAKAIMRKILQETGIYTTIGIGDNMLLAKLA